MCYELGPYFQEKLPKRECQLFTKIPERAIISVAETPESVSYFHGTNDKPNED